MRGAAVDGVDGVDQQFGEAARGPLHDHDSI